MKRLVLLLLALALPAAAQSPQQQALQARPAAWTNETIGEQQVVRGATLEDPGDRLLFLCNNEHRLVAMVFMLSDDPQVVVDGAGATRWVVDGAFQETVESSESMAIGSNVMTITRVDPDLYRRLIAADAAGFAWMHRDGNQAAGFQIEMRAGRALLSAFARACSAEAYP